MRCDAEHSLAMYHTQLTKLMPSSAAMQASAGAERLSSTWAPPLLLLASSVRSFVVLFRAASSVVHDSTQIPINDDLDVMIPTKDKKMSSHAHLG